jgi:hypothetical protein
MIGDAAGQKNFHVQQIQGRLAGPQRHFWKPLFIIIGQLSLFYLH